MSRKVNPIGGSGEVVRDGWCTELKIAEAVGPVDLDPCSNERSHVRARVRACGPGVPGYVDGAPVAPIDGLELASRVPADWSVFLNPGYSRRSGVGRWVAAYAHVRFQFLLRFDPSTEWFGDLVRISNWLWFPLGWRCEFEPPPGVAASSNPYPHAIYSKEPLNEALQAIGLVARIDEEWRARWIGSGGHGE